MPAPHGQFRVARYFVALAALIVALYALVFFTGPAGSWADKLIPKLGLDLQGGTTVTLRASTPDGKAPSASQLEEARQIIENRVNGTGVAEFEVLIEGNRNLVVNVPGKNSEDVKKIGQPAELRFRKVLNQFPSSAKADDKSAKPTPSPTPSPSPGASDKPTREQVLAKFSPSAQQAVAAAVQSGQPLDEANPTVQQDFAVVDQLTPAELAVLPADYHLYIPQITCADLNRRPPGSVVKKDEQVVACERDGTSKLLLDKARVVGTDVASADFGNQPGEGWTVFIKFTGGGQDRWTNLTKESVGEQVAAVLDNEVVSAPTIEQVISGDAQVSGPGITRSSAEDLANKLKYGALPLTFATDNALTISPTLGTEQLKAGLLAGGIGLALVVLYSFLYYRALGLVTITSLIVSGAIVFALVILLGRQLGFTLTLAGVAGFIVAVGITADSFVVFFERLKDEVKEGRSVRSAVPRAWVRARRTILSADAVSFLAAAVLYLLSIGAVKGFAFTLGLSTLVDLVVVFLFTHPLVALLSRSKMFVSPRVSGLANVYDVPGTGRTPSTRVAVAKGSQS